MKRYQCLGFAFAAAFVVATSIINRAEGIAPGTNSMALERLVADALEQNPELKFYEAELAAAKAGRRSAGLLPNPELSGSVGHKSSRELATGIGAEGVALVRLGDSTIRMARADRTEESDRQPRCSTRGTWLGAVSRSASVADAHARLRIIRRAGKSTCRARGG
jgi:hypothetical protein